MVRHSKFIAASMLAFLVVGCAEIPTQELSQYRNAFVSVQNASEDILIDFGEAIAAAEERQAAAAGPPPRPQGLVSASLNDASVKQPDAVEVRRTALRTIDKFNNVLTTLAEGKSVDAMQTAAGGFVEAAGKFVTATAGNAVPGLSAISGLVKTLIGQFEKARLREEFEKAVRAGAPTIDKMLVALIDERIDHLTLRAAETNLRNVDLISEITSGASSVRNLYKSFSAPPSNDPMQVTENALNKTLKPIEKALSFNLPITLVYGTGMPAFGEAQRIIAEQTIAQMRERVAAFESNVRAFEALTSALNSYGAMLEKTRTALFLLVESLDKPQRFELVSEELFEIAFSVKQDVEAFRAARKAVD